MSCNQVTEFGQCHQRARRHGLCSYHYNAATMDGFRIDRYYHAKLVKGLLQSTYEYISDIEVDALFGGRARNDGRRLDAWTI